MHRLTMTLVIALAASGCRGTHRCEDGSRFDERGDCVSTDTCSSGRDPMTGVCTGGVDAGVPDAGLDSGGVDAGDGGAVGPDAGSDAGGCRSDSECTSVGVTACDESSGRCVECTADSETMTCGSMVTCDPVAFACSGRPPDSLDICEQCVASSECGGELIPTRHCVPTTFGVGMFAVGDHCLPSLTEWRTRVGDALAPCPTGVPFQVTTQDREGRMDTYCVPDPMTTTCPAIIDDLFATPCPSGASDCGASGLEDGACALTTCRIPCSSDRDCFAFSFCGTSSYCEAVM